MVPVAMPTRRREAVAGRMGGGALTFGLGRWGAVGKVGWLSLRSRARIGRVSRGKPTRKALLDGWSAQTPGVQQSGRGRRHPIIQEEGGQTGEGGGHGGDGEGVGDGDHHAGDEGAVCRPQAGRRHTPLPLPFRDFSEGDASEVKPRTGKFPRKGVHGGIVWGGRCVGTEGRGHGLGPGELQVLLVPGAQPENQGGGEGGRSVNRANGPS